jgi:dephospho-CoA kinase
MKVVGLAGEPGSGKSAVAREFSRREGVVWIELDREAWETYRPRSPTYWRLVSRFGKGILAPDGAISRLHLAELAFRTEDARQALSAIVHPAVIDRLRERIASEKERGTRVLLVEGALLASSPHVDRTLFDAILVLETSSCTRAGRLAADGRPEHTARAIGTPAPGGFVRVSAEGTLVETTERVAQAIAAL